MHIVTEGQTLLDISIMYSGSPDGIFDIIKTNNIDLSEPLPIGMSVDVAGIFNIEKDIVGFFETKYKTEVATDITASEYLELIQEDMYIPELTFKTKKYKTDLSPKNLPDTLFSKWQAVDKRFLDHNPEIWLFMEKNRKRKMGNDIFTSKSWGHPPHNSGIKFPNSAFYPGVSANGFGVNYQTEFSISNISDEYIHVPINVFDYFKANGPNPIDEDTDLSTLSLSTINGNSKSLSLGMRFAIVIDNPDSTAKNPKLFGQMSAPISLTAVNLPAGDARGYALIFKMTDK